MKKIIAVAMTVILLLSMPICAYAKDTIYNYSENESDYYYSVSVTNDNIQDGQQYVLLILSSGASISNLAEDSIQHLDQVEAENKTVSFNTFVPKTYGEHDVYISGKGLSEPLKIGVLQDIPEIISGTISFTGSAVTGKTITVNTKEVTSENLGELKYKWYRDNILIENAVTNTYVISSEDEEKTIKVVIYSENYRGSLTTEIIAKPAGAEGGSGGNGGGGGGTAEPKIGVSVAKINNGKIDVETSSPKKGKLIYFTVEPDLGYNTKNITVKDNKGNIVEVLQNENKYSFIMPEDSVTIFAEFENINDTLSFVDVKSSDWFYSSVIYAYSKGIMNGVTESEFAPNKETTRGMLVTMLYRLENKPEVTTKNKFSDVKETAYYRDAVVWASTNGIVTGYSENIFGAQNNITREQIATILYRYAEYKTIDVSKGTLENLNAFSDVNKVSSWAMNSMKWACGNQLINGMGNSTLAPKGEATRAQVATLLMRFIENLSK